MNQIVKKPTILIVEDEPDLLRLYKQKFESSGFSALAAKSIQEALGHLEGGENIEAIWLDHYLPKGTGLDLVEKLKSNERWKNIPVFVVSNTSTKSKVDAYIALGVIKFYVKADHPVNEIIGDIEKFLSK